MGNFLLNGVFLCPKKKKDEGQEGEMYTTDERI